VLLAYNSAVDHWVASGADTHRQIIAKWPWKKNKRIDPTTGLPRPVRFEDPEGPAPKRAEPAPVDCEFVEAELLAVGFPGNAVLTLF